MNAEVLLEHFHRLGDAPDAVPRLRRFILDLAVRGKLVDQDPKDETANSLLKKIAKEKAAYQTGRKKEFRVDPLTDEELRFTLPSSWTWARTNDVTVYVQRGKSPKYSLEKKIPVIAQKCVQWADFQLEKAQFIEPASLSKYGEERYVQNGDLLWNSTGHGSLGRLIVFKERFKGKYPIIVADSHVTVIRASKHINPDYLFCWFAGPLVQDEINDKSTGTTNQTELPVGTVLAYDVPLPPLAEQHRIVAKVDELMALCDRLEAAQQRREQHRTHLTAATWQGLVSETEPETTQFALAQLPALTTRKEQIAALRQTILDLAVRGRLVKQDVKEEPAEVLMKRIAKEKESQSTKSKRQTAKAQTRTDVEGPFELPEGWSWASFPEIGKFGRGKSKHRPRNDRSLYVDGTYPLVQTGDVARSKGVVTTYKNLYNDIGLAQSAMWPKGTLCITVAANIADSGILSFDACFPDSVVGFVPAECFSNARYFEYFLRTAKADLLEFAPATAQKNINLEILEAVRIPLPPLAEQRRIVAKVDELMALCDRLEAALEKGEAAKARLLEAVLARSDASAEASAKADDQMIGRSDASADRVRPKLAEAQALAKEDDGIRARPSGERLIAKAVPGHGAEKTPRAYAEVEVALPMAAEPVPRRRGPGRPRKAETQDLGTVTAAITGFLQAHPGWHARSAIVPGAGIAANAWNAAINALLEAGKVERQGAKNGARYRLVWCKEIPNRS